MMKKKIIVICGSLATVALAAHIGLSVFVHRSYVRVIRYRMGCRKAVRIMQKYSSTPDTRTPELATAESMLWVCRDELLAMGYLVKCEIPLPKAGVHGPTADLFEALMARGKKNDFAAWEVTIGPFHPDGNAESSHECHAVTVIDLPSRTNEWAQLVRKYDIPSAIEVIPPEIE